MQATCDDYKHRHNVMENNLWVQSFMSAVKSTYSAAMTSHFTPWISKCSTFEESFRSYEIFGFLLSAIAPKDLSLDALSQAREELDIWENQLPHLWSEWKVQGMAADVGYTGDEKISELVTILEKNFIAGPLYDSLFSLEVIMKDSRCV